MSRVFTLTDGTDSVNLINTAATGIIASRGGFGKNRITPNLEFSSSALTDGAKLRFKNYNPVTETYELNLKASSQDNAASQLQALGRLLRKADLFQTTDWQQTAVYIQQQTTNETNGRFSLVIAWLSQSLDDFFNQPFESDNEIDNFEIFLTREPFWRSTAPGSLSSLEPLRTPDFPYFDSITGTTGNQKVNAAAALSGDWGFQVTTIGSGTEVRGFDETPAAEILITHEWQMKIGTLVMDNNTSFQIEQMNTSTGGSAAFSVLVYQVASDEFFIQNAAIRNGGGSMVSPQFALTTGVNLIRLELTIASTTASSDGILTMFIDDVEVDETTGIDNGIKEVSSLRLGSLAGVDTGTNGTLFFDRSRWDDSIIGTGIAGATFERTIDFENTLPFVSNFRHTDVLSHIFNEDISATGFSSNLIDIPNFTYYEVSGSTPATGDNVYFGGAEPFYHVILNIGVAAVTSGLSIQPQYWNGAAWTNFDTGFDDSDFNNLGHTAILFPGASDWATVAVNGQTKYWVRLQIASLTTWTTSPEQKNEIVYTPNDTYFEINESQVNGDVPAIVLERLLNYISDNTGNGMTWITFGMKTRSLDTANVFSSRFNAGGDNVLGLASYSTDTAQTADNEAPGGNNATTTFSSNQSLVLRFDVGGFSQDAFEGTYRAYLRAKQVGGVAGDVSVQLQIRAAVTIKGEVIPLKQADQGFEIIDLGQFSFRQYGILADEGGIGNSVSLDIHAKSDNGTTPNLECWDIIMIPIDEFAMTVSWSSRTNQGLLLNEGVQIDNGILRKRTLEFDFLHPADVLALTPVSEWETRGKLPLVEPLRKTQVYFLMGGDNSSAILESTNGMGLGINLYLHERWISLRGSD